MNDDGEERARKRYFEPRDLDEMSIDDLQDRIEVMKQEIKSMEAEIEKKRAAKGAADAFFKN